VEELLTGFIGLCGTFLARRRTVSARSAFGTPAGILQFGGFDWIPEGQTCSSSRRDLNWVSNGTGFSASGVCRHPDGRQPD